MDFSIVTDTTGASVSELGSALRELISLIKKNDVET